MKLKTLDIIIINWNSAEYLKRCLLSMLDIQNNNFLLNKIIIVDNNSKDDSLQKIQNIDLPITIIENKKNLGFARACNQGAQESSADYLLFLNPDTELYQDTLDNTFNYVAKEDLKNLGIVSIKLLDANKNVAKTCSRFPTLFNTLSAIFALDKIFHNKFVSRDMREFSHDESMVVEQVIGAFFLIKQEVYRKLHGFDERFFVYYEEVDLCYRAKSLNYLTYFLAVSSAYHKGGGTSEQVKAQRLFYSLRSRILYSYKHFSKFNALIIHVATYFIEPATRMVYALLKRNPQQVHETLRGYYLLYKDTLNIVKTIKQ